MGSVKVLRHCLRSRDVPRLRALVAPAQQNHDKLILEREIHPIARTVIDPEFATLPPTDLASPRLPACTRTMRAAILLAARPSLSEASHLLKTRVGRTVNTRHL